MRLDRGSVLAIGHWIDFQLDWFLETRRHLVRVQQFLHGTLDHGHGSHGRLVAEVDPSEHGTCTRSHCAPLVHVSPATRRYLGRDQGARVSERAPAWLQNVSHLPLSVEVKVFALFFGKMSRVSVHHTLSPFNMSLETIVALKILFGARAVLNKLGALVFLQPRTTTAVSSQQPVVQVNEPW